MWVCFCVVLPPLRTPSFGASLSVQVQVQVIMDPLLVTPDGDLGQIQPLPMVQHRTGGVNLDPVYVHPNSATVRAPA